MKIKLELKSPGRREHLDLVELPAVPRVGEMVQTKNKGALEVIEVTHTPLIRDYDAVVVLRVPGGKT